MLLSFTHNWNNKLANKAFTTIRLRNDMKYFKGAKIERINLKSGSSSSVNYGGGEIVDIRHFNLNQINEFIARLDTGYGVDETKDIIRKMYKDVDFTFQDLSLILIKKDEVKTPSQPSLFN